MEDVPCDNEPTISTGEKASNREEALEPQTRLVNHAPIITRDPASGMLHPGSCAKKVSVIHSHFSAKFEDLSI